ncbi:MAG: TRAP transporter small permease [Pseudorhodobacter sp.]|jgi:C4-dicarboxylate transporter, DctQ subunit|nr:TRAP transporter small permease [Pseudorhodobacter sp.]
MSSQAKFWMESRLGRFVNTFEENAIAVTLGLMTALTFVNVIMRYAFNATIIWGLEVVLMLFAWLVLLGLSYGVKTTMHLGVDAVTNVLPKGPRRMAAILSALICIFYAMLLMKGAWDYWAPFAGLDVTSGRWFPTGFVPTRTRAFMETDQVPMPFFLNFLSDLINDGDAYGKLPDVVPYTMLPVGMALLLFRFVQAGIRIVTGHSDTLIASHEAEEALDELNAKSQGN